MSGTFVNSNSFGCFLGMAVIAAIALIFREGSAGGHAVTELGESSHLLDWLTGLRLALLALALLFAGGLLFSGSRAGLVATVASAVLLGVLLARGRLRSRRHLARVVLTAGVAAALIFVVAGGALMQKVARSSPGGPADL